MQCRACDSTRLELAIDLGSQPCANHFLTAEQVGTEPAYPLRVVWCADCGTAQLDYSVPKEVMCADRTYLSGVSRALTDHFARVARTVDGRFFSCVGAKSVLDIGSNDGTQLKHFQKLGYNVLGVEHSQTSASSATAAGVPTLNTFFGLDTAVRLNRQFHVINASGVFCRLEDLHSATEGIRHCLRNDGVFVVRFRYVKQIVADGAFDQIGHGHLLYYSLRTIQTLLGRHGLALFDAELCPIQGGSIIGYASHADGSSPSARLAAMLRAEEQAGTNDLSTYLGFADRIGRMRQRNLSFLDEQRRLGSRVFGMGAPVRGNTLLNTFGIGTDLVECLVERNELRRGMYSPGMHIPVRIERELPAPPDVYYVLAWNHKDGILANNRHLMDRGLRFYFPVEPQPVAAAEAA